MPTGTAGSTARDFHTNQTHYLTKAVDYTTLSAIPMGTVPANCLITRVYACVTTAFAGASANNVSVGLSGNGTTIAAAISVLSVGVKLDTTTLATAAAAVFNPTADSVVIATFGSTGATTTSGTATVVVEYINAR